MTVAFQPTPQFRLRLYAPSLKLDALADEAHRARDAEDRRHLLDLAECYKRAADQVAAASN